jgi:putative colanic acid biosynthesis acetyltransferase WcaF
MSFSPAPLRTHVQATPYDSPWTRRQRIAALAWEYVWTLFCSWTPKPLNPWRLFVLRLFGAKLSGTPFVHSRARIQLPWNLTMHHRACLGDRANAYTLGPITLGEGATIAQEAYLCTGTHDFASAALPLQTAPIVVGREAFVGARAMILPGLTLGDRAIVGAGAVVTKNVEPGVIVAGNPAKPIGTRAVPR